MLCHLAPLTRAVLLMQASVTAATDWSPGNPSAGLHATFEAVREHRADLEPTDCLLLLRLLAPL